jgi:hypothetical protein
MNNNSHESLNLLKPFSTTQALPVFLNENGVSLLLQVICALNREKMNIGSATSNSVGYNLKFLVMFYD